MNKKIISFIVIACLFMASVVACTQKTTDTGSNTASTEGKKISIVTTIFPPYDFAKAVAGDKAEISMLLPPGAESHSFEPSPQDIIKIQNADLFIYNGGESDEWVNQILESMPADKSPKTLRMMDAVELLNEEVVEGMEEEDHDHGHGDDKDHKDEHHDEDKNATEGHSHEEDKDHSHEGEHHDEDKNTTEEHSHEEDKDHEHEGAHSHEDVMDEHVWTSPVNASKISEAIAQELTIIDPDNAKTYVENLEVYKGKLTELDAKFRKVVENSARKTIVFGDRFPLRYFAHEYGLTYSAAFVGCSTQSDASAATVAFLVDKVKAEKLPAVFYIELSEHKIADAIEDATGAEKLMFHSCHNVTNEEIEAGATYLSLMEGNVVALEKALK